jgi:hypothetical protein
MDRISVILLCNALYLACCRIDRWERCIGWNMLSIKSAWWMSYRPSQGTWITSDYPELVGYPDNSQPQIDAYAMHN